MELLICIALALGGINLIGLLWGAYCQSTKNDNFVGKVKFDNWYRDLSDRNQHTHKELNKASVLISELKEKVAKLETTVKDNFETFDGYDDNHRTRYSELREDNHKTRSEVGRLENKVGKLERQTVSVPLVGDVAGPFGKVKEFKEVLLGEAVALLGAHGNLELERVEDKTPKLVTVKKKPGRKGKIAK